MQLDAALHDVCFVDARNGWAVGDRGVIWATRDGGQTWQRQVSGVRCPLRSVCFLSPTQGWVAGGEAHPYTGTSSGVILSTRDGGKTWQPHRGISLPMLRQIRFFDPQNGWAVGCGSALYPSGAFATQSGGFDWQPISGCEGRAWTTAALLDSKTGALAGRRGSFATLYSGRLAIPDTPPLGLRSLNRLELVPPQYGWLVGDGGLVLLTADLGRSWQTPKGELPDGTAEHFDFAALAVRGPHAWIAGAPGTMVFHSPDAGKTWAAQRTGQSLPIQSLCFADDQHGWAVGAMGTILATADGGQTWQRQRAGGTRAAVLVLASQAEDVPWETLARLSAAEGYLAAVELLNRRDLETDPGSAIEPCDLAAEAVAGVGGSSTRQAWRFPLRQRGLGLSSQQLTDVWDLANDGQGMRWFETYVVELLRMWRPEVVIVSSGEGEGDSLGQLVNQAVLHAAESAGDSTWQAEQITHAGLQPWQVKRVFSVLSPGAKGSPEVAAAELAPTLGRSLADVAAGPRSLVQRAYAPAPVSTAYYPLLDRTPGEQGAKDFFAGIVVAPGGEARRELVEPPPQQLDVLRKLAQKRRNVQAVIDEADRDPAKAAALGAQLQDLTGGLDADSAARAIYDMANRCIQGGRWEQAAELAGLLVSRYPEHPLTRSVMVWAVQYYASAETQWRLQGSQRVYDVKQTSHLSIDLSKLEDRNERAAMLARQLAEKDVALASDPRIGFPLAVAQRNRGNQRNAQQFLDDLMRKPHDDPWWACADGERWLANPQTIPTKAYTFCAAASVKPRLDGSLDDEVWQRCRTIELRSIANDDMDWPAVALVARDSDFLYLALRCRQPKGAQDPTDTRPRPRDADLASRDRVEFFLDLDRDYATYYRLAIDDRGWTAESCWGDRSWDPTWFVASRWADGTWTAEAAIPLDQLTGHYPAQHDAWALGVQRTVPGTGFQSWTRPATTDVQPEGFGLLIFE